jgi:beta-mannosidase
VPPNAATHGNKHVWEAWFREDYAVYRQFEPRFCSEFGFQGPATYASIASVVPEGERDFGSHAMRHRQKCGDQVRDDGDRRNLRHLVRHFNLPGAEELLEALTPPKAGGKVSECGCEALHWAKGPSRVDFDDLHYLLQVNQARALTLGVEWFRSRQPVCMGTLYWQLNDCWPGGTTWSCVDGDGRFKPLWYATRRFYRPSLYTIQPEGDGSLYLCEINDSDEPEVGRVLIARRGFDGRVLAEQEVEIDCPPRSVRRVKIDPAVATPGDASREFITAGFPPRAIWFFDVDKALAYPQAKFKADLARQGGEYRLMVQAESLLRDLCVFVDRLDPAATISEQLVTLLPGESFTFAIRSARELKLEELTRRPVLRCVNGFGGGSSS